jgi:hypothetical protein
MVVHPMFKKGWFVGSVMGDASKILILQSNIRACILKYSPCVVSDSYVPWKINPLCIV